MIYTSLEHLRIELEKANRPHRILTDPPFSTDYPGTCAHGVAGCVTDHLVPLDPRAVLAVLPPGTRRRR